MMTTKAFFFLGVSLLFALAAVKCVDAGTDAVFPQPVSCRIDSNGDLVGKITKEKLYKAFPAWEDDAAHYVASPEIVEELRKVDKPVDIVMFLGTWCKDSRSEVPKFLKLLDSAENGNYSLVMYAVDRSKKNGDGLSEKYQLTRIPTMIFVRGGKELGRMVEYPKVTVEEDFLAIVTGIH